MAKSLVTLENLAAQLKELSDSMANESASQLPAQQAKKVRRTISEAYEKLFKIMADLDPIKTPDIVFNPSNPDVAARIVAITMIAQTRKPLMNVERSYGSGVYAIYYNGAFPAYEAISKKETPIYVGKADPANPKSRTVMEQGDKLSARLSEHRKNIEKATGTLRVADFEYRALVVQTGWQGSAEKYLIHLFNPIWNNEAKICYGFGKHGDAPETRANLRSPWDTLHPGRDWAHRDTKMKDARLTKRIVGDIAQHLAKSPPIGSIDEILRRFLDEMRTLP